MSRLNIIQGIEKHKCLCGRGNYTVIQLKGKKWKAQCFHCFRSDGITNIISGTVKVSK